MGVLFDATAGGSPRTTITSVRGRCSGRQVRDAAERLAGWLASGGHRVVTLAVSDLAPAAAVMLAADLAGVTVRYAEPTSPRPPAGTVVRDVGPEGTGSGGYGDDSFGLYATAAADGSWPADVPPAAHVFLTSGSTGTPVGVVRGGPAVLADAARVSRLLGYDAGRPVLVAAPVNHAYGFNYGLLGPLLAGADIVYVGPRTIPSQLARSAAAHAADTLITHPAQYRLIADAVRRTGAGVIGGLRQAVSAGAPLPAGCAATIVAQHDFTLYNCYGSSEAGAVTLSPVHGREPAGDAGMLLPGVAGRVAESGELLLRTDGLASGSISADRYAPIRTTDGWYATGDLAEIAGARLRLLGRVADVINVAGKKVNPAEIERVLAAHPAVTEVDVVGAPDATRGTVPVALVTGGPGLTVADLTTWCRERLDGYKVPRRIEIREALPRSATGKRIRAVRGTDG